MGDNAPLVQLHVGARVQHKGATGTVRYLGTLHDQGEERWVGVQWDNAMRGKHSGIYKGIHYFTSTVPNAATFVKANKLGSGGRIAILQAARRRFADAIDHSHRDHTTVVGGAVFDIADEGTIMDQLASISVLDVSGLGVAAVTPPHYEELHAALPKLRELNVSRSLFVSIEAILHLMRAFPTLALLDASRNELQDNSLSDEDDDGIDNGDGDREEIAQELEQVILNHCVVSWNGVRLVCEHIKALCELRLHNCTLSAFGPQTERLLVCWQNLRVLDLDDNSITWDDVQALSTLPELRELYISHNALPDHPGLTPNKNSRRAFLQLHTLSMAGNALDGWQFISWLQHAHGLRHLRVAGNPITGRAEHTVSARTSMARLRVIGRIAGLQRVDGSWISADERLQAERWYTQDEIMVAIRAHGLEATLQMHPRAGQLALMYGDTVANTSCRRTGESMRDNTVVIALRAHNKISTGRKAASRLIPTSIQAERLAAVARCVLRVDENCPFDLMIRTNAADNHHHTAILEEGQALSTLVGSELAQVVVECIPHK